MNVSSNVPSAALHYAIVVAVFAITGTFAVALSRVVLVEVLGLDGSLWSGPWSFRIAYLALIPPSYSVMLLLVGRLFGKYDYFKKRVMRIWGRPLRLLGLAAAYLKR